MPHAILTAAWEERPRSAIQERARTIRYELLRDWARERGMDVLATAHHLDDQAETLLMRLARGAGVRGLAAMRPLTRIQGGVALVRPLLGWRHSELRAVCAAAGVEPIRDPSNEDEQFERVRVRNGLAQAAWLNAGAIAQSAAHLADADVALDWAADLEWRGAVTGGSEAVLYVPGDAPSEIRRRILRRAILALATEGGPDLRGYEVDQLIDVLQMGGRATLRGVLCAGGPEWRFSHAPARRAVSAQVRAIEGQ